MIEAAYERLKTGPPVNYLEDLERILDSVPRLPEATGTEASLQSTGKDLERIPGLCSEAARGHRSRGQPSVKW